MEKKPKPLTLEHEDFCIAYSFGSFLKGCNPKGPTEYVGYLSDSLNSLEGLQ